MPRRWFGGWCGGWALLALACDGELVETVPKDVCYSGLRWIGGERGSAEMYPGRDCVGCHLENDGPRLMLGGTLYPYVFGQDELYKLNAAQSGEDCFGIEGITITIEDAEQQIIEVVTNRAGNFFVEGDPASFAKPFTARITNFQKTAEGARVRNESAMLFQPQYGGCARCHDRNLTFFNPEVDSLDPLDSNYRYPAPPIGLPGYYEPENYPVMTVQQELEAIARAKGVE